MARPVYVESDTESHDAASHPLRHRVRIGPHRLIVDEPEAAGGTDTGPTPVELLLAALGA